MGGPGYLDVSSACNQTFSLPLMPDLGWGYSKCATRVATDRALSRPSRERARCTSRCVPETRRSNSHCQAVQNSRLSSPRRVPLRSPPDLLSALPHSTTVVPRPCKSWIEAKCEGGDRACSVGLRTRVLGQSSCASSWDGASAAGWTLRGAGEVASSGAYIRPSELIAGLFRLELSARGCVRALADSGMRAKGSDPRS